MTQTQIPKGPPPPVLGSDIYIRSAYYLGHGRDDFEGGLCRVARVTVGISAGDPAYFVEVEERPGWSFNWSTFLSVEQEKLRAKYGNRRGYQDPDDRPEFNDDSGWMPVTS